MTWWIWLLIILGSYFIASIAVTIWYCLSPTAVPNKWLDRFCYPVVLLILLYASLTGKMKD